MVYVYNSGVKHKARGPESAWQKRQSQQNNFDNLMEDIDIRV